MIRAALFVFAACVSPTHDASWKGASWPPARNSLKSELILKCVPSDAEVTMDQVPQGTCEDFRGEPKGLLLGQGVRRVSVKKAGYWAWESAVEADGTRVMLQVTLLSTGGSR